MQPTGLDISDYKIIDELYENEFSMFFRVEISGSYKLLKLAKFESELAEQRLDYEYAIIKELETEKHIDFVWFRDSNQKGILFHDFEGIPLNQYLKQVFTLETYLQAAIQITGSLEKFHLNKMVYGGLRPDKILINQENFHIRFMDYGACFHFKEKESDCSPYPEAGPEYLAPEQTGKLNRLIDYRSDLYSLGVLLFEMMAGEKPFFSEDPNEIIHAHIARMPPQLFSSEINVPPVLAAIVNALLSKNAQNRYQSAFGLKADLYKCYRSQIQDNKIESFSLGQNDYSIKVRKPERLIGRQKELEFLKDSFTNDSGEDEKDLIMLVGKSGVGKSALLKALKGMMVNDQGFYLSGSFDQDQNIPYQAFKEAVSEMVGYIISRQGQRFQDWQGLINEALYPNGKVLTDLIPNLEAIIGAQPEVPVLPPMESQNRLNYEFIKFLRVIEGQGFVIHFFLDNLHWADPASKNLLTYLLQENGLVNIKIAATFLDNSLEKERVPLGELSELSNEKVKVHNLYLGNLSLKDSTEMLANCLHMSPDEVQKLALVIYSTTEGNPYFTLELLSSLNEKTLLFFDYNSGSWKWDLEGIRNLKISGNVAELIDQRIKKLSAGLREFLQLVSCMGNGFYPETAKSLFEKPEEEVMAWIKEAMSSGFLFKEKEKFRFSGDKLKQSVYASIEPQNIPNYHLQIARAIYPAYKDQEDDTVLFNLAGHFIKSLKLLDSSEERKRVSKLLNLAGVKAKRAAAFKAGYEFFHHSILLLEKDAERPIRRKLNLEGAECAYLIGLYDIMEEMTEQALIFSEEDIEKIDAFDIRIRAYTAQGRFLEAVDTAVSALKLTGITFPRKPNKLSILVSYIKTRLYFKGRSIEDLETQPTISNEVMKAAQRIIANVGSAAYFARQDLFPLFILKAFTILLRFGNSEFSAFVTASYGLLVSAGLKQYGLSEKFKLLTYNYLGISADVKYGPRSIFMINTFLAHYHTSLRQTYTPLSIAYDRALKEGDIEYAAYCQLVESYNRFLAGERLTEILPFMTESTEIIARHKQDSPWYSNAFYNQAAWNLNKITDNPSVMEGPIFNELETEPLDGVSVRSQSSLFDYSTSKIIISYLFEDLDAAYKIALDGEKFKHFSLGTSIQPVFFFYQSLTMIQLSRGRPELKNELMRYVHRNLKELKNLSRFAPMNFEHKHILIRAELLAMQGKSGKAIELFNLAASKAAEHEYFQEEALAIELLARFYFQRSDRYLGEFYIKKAIRLYERWGANAKVNQLNEKYFNIRLQYQEAKKEEPEHEIGQVSTFDSNSFIKAAIAISSNLEMDKLLEKLIQIAFEYANADKGFLVLKSNKEFLIEAEGNINKDEIKVLQSLPVDQSDLIPPSILHFVTLTKENLVIHDALKDSRFSHDLVIQKNQCKSILCIPIIHYEDFMGMLYLENTLITGAFTEERINILKLLSGQMAVSFENAFKEKRKSEASRLRESRLKKQHKRQELIARKVLRTQEEERKRIAEELHDGLGYMLSTLKLNLSAIHEKAELKNERKYLESSLNLLEDSFAELRSISNNLMPNMLHQHGLIIALESLCQKISATGRIEIVFRHFKVEGKFSEVFGLQVFRIIQEIVNNVLKHARAKTLELQIIRQEKVLVITAEDDGIGFDYEKKSDGRPSGRGLVNIVNRVKYLKGNVNYDSSSAGTNVLIKLPISGHYTLENHEN